MNYLVKVPDGKFWGTSPHLGRHELTDDISRARLFNSIGAAKGVAKKLVNGTIKPSHSYEKIKVARAEVWEVSLSYGNLMETY